MSNSFTQTYKAASTLPITPVLLVPSSFFILTRFFFSLLSSSHRRLAVRVDCFTDGRSDSHISSLVRSFDRQRSDFLLILTLLLIPIRPSYLLHIHYSLR